MPLVPSTVANTRSSCATKNSQPVTSNLAEQRYSDEVPEEVLTLWEPPALQWAHTVYQRAPMQRGQRRYIAIYHQLKTERPGPKRSRLVAEAYRLQYRTLH